MKKINFILLFFLIVSSYSMAQLNPLPLTNYQVLKGNIDSLIAGDVLVVRNASTVNGNPLDVVMTITGIFAPYKYANGSNGVPSSAKLTFGGTDHGTGIYDNLRFVGVNVDKNPWVTYSLHFSDAGTATATNLAGTKILVSNVQSYLPYLSGPAYDATLPGRKYSNIAGVKTPMAGSVVTVGANLENEGFFNRPLQYGSPVYPDITDVPPPTGFNMFRDIEVNNSTGIISTPFAPVYGDPDFTVRIDYESYPADGVEYIFGISNNPATPNSDTCDFAPNRTMYVTFVTTDTSESLSATFKNVSANIINNKLSVSWQTLTEANNDHFNIEASNDGVHFKKIGEQKTLNKDGNSSAPTDYTFTISAPATAALAGFTIALLFGGVFMYGKKKKLAGGMFALSVLCALFVMGACNKNTDKVNTDSSQNLYIRIQQVDKDGSSSYSDVIKAVRQ